MKDDQPKYFAMTNKEMGDFWDKQNDRIAQVIRQRVDDTLDHLASWMTKNPEITRPHEIVYRFKKYWYGG